MLKPLTIVLSVLLTLLPVRPVFAAPLAQDLPESVDEIHVCEDDDRVASTDSRVGRLSYVNRDGSLSPFCTAWLISNGALLTAGHCVDEDPDNSGPQLPDGKSDWVEGGVVVEFNVPPSSANGTPTSSAPTDQYAVNSKTVNWRFPGNSAAVGRDWAIFKVYPNPITKRTAHQQNGFFRVTNRNPNTGEQIRVTGYGTDDGTANRTEQTAVGEYKGENDNDGAEFLEYTTYTAPATSGGPVIWDDIGMAMGINTHGPCENGFLGFGNNYNKGTSFDSPEIGPVINSFNGIDTVHVDTVVHLGAANGWIFNPYNSVAEAVVAVPAHGKISIAAGTYNGPVIIDKPITLIAPSGTVVIGQ